MKAEAAPAGETPFLSSGVEELPVLKKVRVPVGAVAEFQQQMSREAIDLPTGKVRSSMRTYAEKPSPSCPPEFRFACNAFFTARRAVTASTLEEAEAMVSAETLELIASARGEKGKHASIPPRPVCIALVIPKDSVNNANATPFVDGFAALSDLKPNGVPLATKVRFDIFGGENSIPIAKTLHRTALDHRAVDGVSLVARWASVTESGQYVRTECLSTGYTSPNTNETSSHLQTMVLKMSTLFGFELPAEFFLPPIPATEGYYEKQIRDCSNEWKDLLYKEEPFSPSAEMLRTGSSVLSRVQGCFVRLSPIALGVEGVVSSNAIHAMLLCAEGREEEALKYAKKYREGLRPPDGEDALIDLHALTLHTEPLFLNGMVSLYAHGGKSGESLKSDGNWVYKTTAAVISVQQLSSRFFVMSCGMESMVPEQSVLLKFMNIHTNKSIEFFDKLFNHDDLRRIQSTTPTTSPVILSSETEHMSRDERFLLSGMGVDLKSQRMLIGEAIAFLMQSEAPSPLIQMLTNTAARIGLGASLADGYTRCAELIKDDKKKDELHAAEVCRLKRVADAAIVLGASKKACQGLNETKPEKVRALLKVFSLKAGASINERNIFKIPRTASATRSLALVTYTAYYRKQVGETPHVQELQAVFMHYVDILAALGKCLHLCMVPPGKKKDAFVIVHGSASCISVHQVGEGGVLQPCGEGKIFESKSPCLLILKMKSDVDCVVTPMIIE